MYNLFKRARKIQIQIQEPKKNGKKKSVAKQGT
jgi:hypothetical protein